MDKVNQWIDNFLEKREITPILGELIPEQPTAELLGYAPSYLRRIAACGQSPIPFVKRGNRRLYRLDDIRRFAAETVA